MAVDTRSKRVGTNFTRELASSWDAPGEVDAVFSALSDPAFLTTCSPFVQDVVREPGADTESVWRWRIGGIAYPGGTYAAEYLTDMSCEAPSRIVFVSRASDDSVQPPSSEFHAELRLSPVGEPHVCRVDLRVWVSAHVQAPRVAATVVEGAMGGVLAAMRLGLARSLERRLHRDTASRREGP